MKIPQKGPLSPLHVLHFAERMPRGIPLQNVGPWPLQSVRELNRKLQETASKALIPGIAKTRRRQQTGCFEKAYGCDPLLLFVGWFEVKANEIISEASEV